MDKALEDIQIELEAEQVQQGVDKYRAEVAKAKEKGTEKTLKPQQSMLHRTIPLIAKGIQNTRTYTSPGVVPLAVQITRNIDKEVLAFIVCTEVINNMSQQVTIQTVCNKIASSIKDYILLEDFKENCGGLYRYAVDKINTGNVKHKRNALRHYAKFGGTNDPDMRNLMLVGRWFLNLFTKYAPNIVVIYMEMQGRKRVHRIKPTPQTLEWIETQHNFYEDQFPKNMPMVVKPYQWTNGHDGGYRLSVYPLIKYKSEAQMAEIHQTYYMDRVYKAIHVISFKC